MLARAQLVSCAVEQALAHRGGRPFAGAARSSERMPFGVGDMDAIAHGGAPVGAITELVGPASSGRTTAAFSLLRSFTARGSVCAWIDVSDALSPCSAAANGLDLQQLLWVRCRDTRVPAEPMLTASRDRTTTATDAEFSVQVAGKGPHPRTESRNMPEAIQAAFGSRCNLLDRQEADRARRQRVGTPGAPNRPLTPRSVDREEQVAEERLPPRRGEQLSSLKRGVNKHLLQAMRTASATSRARSAADSGTPWKALDAALRATDLLLTNGGFAAIVLDLGSTPAELAWRIPLATWFRYRAACEQSRSTLLVVTPHPCARSSAGLVLRLAPGAMVCDGPVMTGVRFGAEVERSRFTEQAPHVVPIRKAPQPERAGTWTRQAAWA